MKIKRQPYQILVDGTFTFAALNNQVNIADNIPRYLHGELKLLTTHCVIVETENLGPKLHGALVILKQYALHKCGHEGKAISGAKCLLSMIGKSNEQHYIIATQDRDLQQKVRSIPGVPLLYLHSKAPVLEQPSDVSLKKADVQMNNRFDIPAIAKSTIDDLKHKVGLVEGEDTKPKRRKKKGPNPLSCKKKKKKLGLVQPIRKMEAKTDTDKKKRKKIRIPKHVKEELFKSTNK